MTKSISDMLRDTAMAAEINCASLGLSRTDNDTSREVERDKHAVSGAVKTLVSRLPGADDLPKRLTNKQREVRDMLRDNSMVWGKMRLLPNSKVQDVIVQYTKLNNEFMGMKAELEAVADSLIQQALSNRGQLNVEPPTREELTSAYDMNLVIEPLPDKSNISQHLDPEFRAWCEQQFDARAAHMYTEAKRDTVRRMYKPLQAMTERLKLYEERLVRKDASKDEKLGRDGVFRDTLLTNVQELYAAMKDFNLDNDPALQDIIEALKPFSACTGDMLRDRANVREGAQAAVAAILKKADNYLGV